jgi:dTMP kinase
VLIAFEGLPGAGKTTQARLLTEHLRRSGLRVAALADLATLRTDPLGEALWALFSSSGDPFRRQGDVVIDTHLAAAIRTTITATLIDPALAEHDVVIEDRGLHTMYSYSLAGLLPCASPRVPCDIPAAVGWLTAVGDLTGTCADYVVLLRPPFTEAVQRAARRDGTAATAEQRAFLRRVDGAYTELARLDPRVLTLDLPPGAPVQAVHRAVLAALDDALPSDSTECSEN